MGDELLIFSESDGGSSEECCHDGNVLTCSNVNVNPGLLGEDLSINGVVLSFTNEVPPHGFAYSSEAGDTAVLSYNEDNGVMFGSLHTKDGKAFSLEKCHDGHVWKEYDVSSFPEEDDAVLAPGIDTSYLSVYISFNCFEISL